jgi:hypothetical protein
MFFFERVRSIEKHKHTAPHVFGISNQREPGTQNKVSQETNPSKLKMDYERVMKMAREKDLKGTLLERLQALQAKPKVETLVLEEREPQNKSTEGVRVRGMIMSLDEKTGARNLNYTDYSFLLSTDFDGLEVPANAGTLVDKNELRLNVLGVRKMTDSEIKEHKDRCERENANSYEKSRTKERNYVKDREEILTPGLSISLRHFGSAFSNRNVPFGSGDSVIVQLYPEIDLDTVEKVVEENGERRIQRTGVPSKWGVRYYATNMWHDRTAENQSASDVWNGLKEHNCVPNLRSDAGFGPSNQSAEELEFERNLSRPTKLDEWKVARFKVPQARRKEISQPLILDLFREHTGPTPEQMLAERALVVDNPQFHSNWVVTREQGTNKETWRVASFETTAETFTNGGERVRLLVNINSTPDQRRTNQEPLNAYGIVNVERWGNVAETYVPLCSGTIVLKLDLLSTINMAETRTDMNPRSSDGTYPEGVVYGATYNTTVLLPNVASGVVRAGLRISRTLAERMFAKQFNNGPSLDSIPKAISSLADKNPLTRKQGGDIYNVFEGAYNFKLLEESGYVFYIVGKTSKRSEIVQTYIQEIRETVGSDDDAFYKMLDEIITDRKSHKGYIGFPVEWNTDKAEYCVFAVKRSVADQYEKPAEVPSEEQFLQQLLELSNKRPAESAEPEPKRQAVEPKPEDELSEIVD